MSKYNTHNYDFRFSTTMQNAVLWVWKIFFMERNFINAILYVNFINVKYTQTGLGICTAGKPISPIIGMKKTTKCFDEHIATTIFPFWKTRFLRIHKLNSVPKMTGETRDQPILEYFESIFHMALFKDRVLWFSRNKSLSNYKSAENLWIPLVLLLLCEIDLELKKWI